MVPSQVLLRHGMGKVSSLLRRFLRSAHSLHSFANYRRLPSLDFNHQAPMRGFTLVEMVVSIGIFVMISGIVLTNFNGFNTRVLLSNLAYDIALTTRQAQVYGISVRELGSGAGDYKPYGIYVEDGSSTTGEATLFLLFSDLNSDNTYGVAWDGTTACTPGTECVDKYTIQRGNKISSFCLENTSLGQSTCSPNNTNNLDKMAIIFKRPNPDALFFGVADSGSVVASPNKATITVSTPDGSATKVITILSTGQISVN